MTRSRAILAATSIAAAAVLLVAGCDDDPPATPSPEPTAAGSSAEAPASPSPTSTAVVVAPERPKAMDDDGPAGAEAAAVYFLELDDYMMKTGDTKSFEQMSTKNCQFCAKRVDQSNELQERAYSWEGDQPTPRIAHTYEQDATTGIWPIDVEVTQSIKILDATGETVSSTAKEKVKLAFEVGRQNNRWVVVEVGQVDGDEQ